jgi:glycosyltransferase involved in cell wall biosynthesis
MAPESPRISVIIPVHNGEEFLAETIQSVLGQNQPSLEIIVVDNGSTDGTADVARSFGDRLRHVYQDNSGGPSSPRNKGIGLARGELLIFLDADDLWPKTRLETQLPYMDDPETEIVLGHTQRFWARKGTRVYDQFTEPDLAMKLTASLIRRTVFDKVGLFDTTLRFCDDWDWYMRAREMGIRIVIHPEVAIYYRRHDHNLTNQENLANKELIMVLKRSIDRRRKRGLGKANSMSNLSDFLEPPG